MSRRVTKLEIIDQPNSFQVRVIATTTTHDTAPIYRPNFEISYGTPIEALLEVISMCEKRHAEGPGS